MNSPSAASKHALTIGFDSPREEAADAGLTVTLICPGYIQTDVSKNALTGDGTPTNKTGDDIANGYPADLTAKQIVDAVAAKKSEVFVGRKGKEFLALMLKRFAPGVLERQVRTAVPK